jgi:hypothetical protein
VLNKKRNKKKYVTENKMAKKGTALIETKKV